MLELESLVRAGTLLNWCLLIAQEARSIGRCRRLGIPAPTLFSVDLLRNRLYMEDIQDSCRIRDILMGDISTIGLSNLMITDLAAAIGRTVSRLHQGDLIHGDLTTSNMLIRREANQLVLIDFGLSQQSSLDEDKAVDLMVLERCIESSHSTIAQVLLGEIYRNYCGHDVLKRLDQVRLRGRKRTPIG
mmetsp:Transcript_9806/g.19982  ORF Transcript_9806/g.19982 Transcript_9806/m.19982 type:complete len:188 (-) Transcript_9806:569-1132(-)